MAVNLLTICAIAAVLLIATADAGSVDDSRMVWPTTESRCTGSIAECMAAGEEFDLDSESNRRILATSNYISYGALQRNSVPCSRRGSSYYNCQPGSSSNPYSRSCSTATRCRS